MTFSIPTRPLHTLGVLAIGGMLMIGASGTARAQDPTATTDAIVTHPSHIHKGTCATLDPNPAYPLSDVGPRTKDNKLPSADDIKGSLTAPLVEYSESTADVKMDDLLKESYALNVHESAQNIQKYIACGDIGGPVLDDKLFIALLPQNNSGYAGIAILEKDGDKTKVTVYLSSAFGAQATPSASPTPRGPTPTPTA